MHATLDRWLDRVEAAPPDWDMGEESTAKFIAGYSTDGPREPGVAHYEEGIQKALAELENPGATPVAAWTAAHHFLKRALETESLPDRYLQMRVEFGDTENL